ncbi:MAG: hypothetical protein UT03_C0026G0005 [Candidatus Moranbacteria bacterium GW2011_GWD2_38_7]|nr:MAG: hypothetical protein UT03_C0026G0005 [Candidatus Moranbacteria bacterium GW2011_GWD2_38_7]
MLKQKKQKFIDITCSASQLRKAELNKILSPGKLNSTLFSGGRKMDKFFTEDSKLYITPSESAKLRKGIRLDRKTKKWDSLSSRIVNDFVYRKPSQASILLDILERRYEMLNESFAQASESIESHFSLVRLWNLSIVGSVLFGMVMMTFVYRYLGQGAAANQLQVSANAQQMQIGTDGKVSATDTSRDGEEFTRQVLEIERANDKKYLEQEIREMVKGYPIEKMAPYIAQQDRTVAAFIIGIAKKESAWGQRVPTLNGQDCYNYWGYRGQRKLMGTGGHTCFNSPKDAVDTVAKRISTLVEEHGKDTPAKMVNTWKCGTSCEGDAGAPKWISDVTMYFDKLNSD